MKEDEIQDSNSIQEDGTASGLMAEFGTVQSIDLDAKQITIARGESDEDVLVLNIDEDTYYVDSVSGEVLDKSTLKEGAYCLVWIKNTDEFFEENGIFVEKVAIVK